MASRVSFVLPSFNSVAWLPQAVSSCLEQSHKDVEVIVVDDCSTDATQDYLDWQVKADKRVVAYRNQANAGRAVSRNLGNDMATGDVSCVLDADDLALPNRAKIVADKFKSGCEFLYGSAVGIDACGRNLGEIRADVFNREKAIETMENRIVHSSCAYTRDFARRFPYTGGDVARLGLDDWELQIRAAMAGIKMEFVPNVLSCYRVLDGAISQTRNAEEVRKFKTGYLEGLRASV